MVVVTLVHLQWSYPSFVATNRYVLGAQFITYDVKVWIWHVNGLVHGGGDSSAFTVKLPQFCGNQ